jgi:cytochrome c-type biogenesis protein CcmH
VHRLLLGFILALLTVSVQAKDAPTVAADPVLEKRVLDLSAELRCLVCQNQTIADSHAELAIDLKNQVREKLSEGMSDKDVIAFMVQRYGDFVLYRPPVKGTTWLLWFGPFLLLIGGLVVLGLKLARRRTPPETLPDSDLQRAAALLGNTTDTKGKS